MTIQLGEHGPEEEPVRDCDCRRCAIAERDRLRSVFKKPTSEMIDAFLFTYIDGKKSGFMTGEQLASLVGQACTAMLETAL